MREVKIKKYNKDIKPGAKIGFISKAFTRKAEMFMGTVSAIEGDRIKVDAKVRMPGFDGQEPGEIVPTTLVIHISRVRMVSDDKGHMIAT